MQDYEQSDAAPTWIRPHLQSNGRGAGADVLARVNEVRFYRAGTLALSNGAKVIAHASPSATKPHAPLAVVTQYGEGRVVVLADSDLFSDDTIGEHDHADLWINLVYWAAGPAFAQDETTVSSPAFRRPGVADAQGRDRGAARAPERRRLDRPGRARTRRRSTRSCTRSRRCARTSRTRTRT